ncbi:hypothetical protein GCM10017655_36330 [Pseudomonas turukhanskensis]|uniref:VWFA domain-containing protein n=1 Tax=Pseudomonas turukhanskensis TaxID=1806536 RepID=A0A9W6K9K8_9PSED|nr:hypothetical protein GCM10017655_36330 [Pseudomonas turukhanskensis]
MFAGDQLVTGHEGAVAVALTNGQELTLGRESSLTLDGSMLAQTGSGESAPPDATDTPPANGNEAAPTDQQLTDVEQLQAAIEAGADPTQAGEATAAGPGAGTGGGPGGAGGGRSFVLLSETAGSVAPEIGFPTEGLIRGPEFPEPEAGRPDINVAAADPAPDAGNVTIDLDEDSDLPGSLEGSPYGDDQPGVPASLTGNLGYSFGADGPGGFSWNAVDLSGLTSHGLALVAVISADGTTLTAHQGSADGPVVFTATNTNPLTGDFSFEVQLPLDHPVAGAEDTLNLQLGYTITDGNGTPSGGTLTVNVNDDSPELVTFEGEGNGDGPAVQAFPHVGGTVHEDALTQAPSGEGPTLAALPAQPPLNAPYEGNNEDSDPQGADNDPAQTVHAGIEAGPGSLTSLVNFGADGIGSFGLVGTEDANALMQAQGLTSGGVALTYTVEAAADGSYTTLTASGPGYDVFTLQVGADGSFSFTLQGPLDHLNADGNDGELLGNGEVVGIDFTHLLTATDFDGDPVVGFGQATGLFTIDVEDDVPSVGNTKVSGLDEDGLSGGIPGGPGDADGAATSVSGNLDYAAGGDGLQSVALSGPTTLGGESVTSTWDASTNTLTISSARGSLVTVELTNPATGAYTVTLLQPLIHEALDTEDDITLNVGITVTDGDNDQASGTLTVNINDDSPTISVSNSAVGSLVVDDSNLGVDGHANYSSNFTVNFGADGAGSTTYRLTSAADGTNSGLKDSASGNDIFLYKVGDDIVGKVGGAAGATSFVVSINSATGEVTLDQQLAIIHSPDTGPDQATGLAGDLIKVTATITDSDGDSSSASLDLGNAISFHDDGPSTSGNALVLLDDDALANGIAGGVNDDADAQNVSGTLAHNYGADGEGSIQWLTTGAPAGFTYQTSGTDLLVQQGGTTVMTVSLNSSTGEYNVVQNAPIDHANADNENNQEFTFNYQVTDKDGDEANGTLQVNVDDDTPVAQNDVANLQVGQGQSFNTVFVLDFSGSISNSELNQMLVGVKAAAQALFTGTTGDVHAQIVLFSGDAQSYPTFDNYADFAAQIDAINPSTGGIRPYEGNTDFTEAVHQVVTDFTPIAGASNQVFFISDGNPNENTGTGGNSLSDAGAIEWNNFIDSNHINVTTIGVGNGVDTTHLQQVDLDGSGTPILVDDFGDLVDTLLDQVSGFVNGNVLNGSDGVAGTSDDDGYGADGAGHIQSIQVGGVTYVWDGVNTIDPSSGANFSGSQLNSITTPGGGSFSFNFATGAWSYSAPDSVNGDKVETFQYTIVDHDGDPSSATLTVYVEDTSPVVATVDEDELAGGITDNDAFTTIATGSVSDLSAAGSGAQFSLSTNTGSLPAATSHGVALVYSVVGDTLTATAGPSGPQVFTLQVESNGDYTFTLKGPLDHPVSNGDDNEQLTLDFASILQATNGVNPLPLAGGFLVNIEDDVPTIAAGNATPAALQVDETNLLVNASHDFSGSFTGQHGADAAGTTTYSLNVSSAGANSGLKDSGTGADILLYKEGNTVVGKAGGLTVFTLSVDGDGVVTLDQQRPILHSPDTGVDQAASLSAANLVQLTATITDYDGDHSSATLNLGNAISFKDDGPSVTSNSTAFIDDDTLPNGNASGIGDDADGVNTTGTLAHSYGADGAGSIQWLTTGAPSGFTYDTSPSGALLIKQGGTTVVTVALNNSTGAYTVTQNAPIDHPDGGAENNQSFILGYQVSDKDGDKAIGTLSINVDDDTPLAKGDQAYVQVAPAQSFNTAFVLDFSGSIDNGELNQMLVAVKAAAQALFAATTGDVHAQIVVFSSDAQSYPTFDNYADFAAKIDALNPATGGTRPFDGNTDFTDAVHQVVTDFTPIPGASNQVFFISDGNPNQNTGSGGNSLSDAGAIEWNNFVDSNHINVTTIGVGNGIDTAHLQQVDLDGSGAPILVGDFADLVDTLVGQVAGVVNGNVLLGNNNAVGGGDDDGYGADGPGHIQSIQVDGVTYTWDGVNTIDPSGAGANISGNSLSNITTALGGTLSFNFSTGGWTYTAPPSVTGDQVESFTYTIIDHDGDPSSATLTVYVEDASPVIGRVDEDEVANGITDGDTVNTIATGNVGDLVSGPATAQFSLLTNTSGLTAATSHGTALVYSVSGDTLTAKAGASGPEVFTLKVESDGDYTFTLKGPLDHPTGNGDDNELLTLNFASILKATDGASNPLALAGGFLIQVEDDVPVVGLATTPVPTLQVDETNLAGNATASFANAFTGGSGADVGGATTYSLTVSAAGVSSGLKDTATGNDILLYKVGNDIVGRVGTSGATSFVVSVDASGNVTLDQRLAISHSPDSGPDQVAGLGGASIIQLTATRTDYDGDHSSATLNLGSAISFKDDAPSISLTNATLGSLQVDETNLAGNATANFASSFSASGGADGVASTSYSLKVSAAGVDSGLDDSATGQNILLSNEGGVIVGRTAGSNELVFSVSVNSSTGAVTLDQVRSILHSPDTGPDQAIGLAASNLVQLTATVTDKDGDTATSTLNLGGAISFKDDAPSISAGTAVADSLQVDESNLASNATANFASSFTAAGGADGIASTSYSLKVSAAGVDSGLDDSATGQNVLLSNEGGVIVGRTASSNELVFSVSVNSTTGAVTLDQARAVLHSPNTGVDQEVSLSAANLVQLVATVTDKDGDSSSASLNLGSAISFKDDGPSISLSNATPLTLQVDETNLAANAQGNFAGAFTASGGADGLASTTYSLNVSAAGVNSGLKDSATGSDVLMYKVGNDVVGRVGGTTVFTVSVDSATGQVTLDQARAILHLPNAGPDQATGLAAADLLQLVATVKDTDGDSASTTLNLGNAISFRDDAPSAANITQSGQASAALNTNLMIVLDNSGSMGDGSGVGNMSRMDIAKNALLELFEQYDALGDVKVSVVSFSTTATVEEVWVSIADAKAAVLALQPTNTTNYDDALIKAIAAYGQTGSDGGKVATGNVQNVAYFLSDGEPNEPSNDAGISNDPNSSGNWPTGGAGISEEQAWINFLSSNNVRAYALGMGTGVSVTELNPIAYNGTAGGGNTNGTVVTDLNTLTQVLVSTAQASPLNGNLTAGGSFGADGGYVRSLTVDGKTYTYDKTSNVVTATSGASFTYSSGVLSFGLSAGGSLAVNVASGAYSYTPPSVVSTAIAASILFTLIDLDGDTASAALNIAISAGQAPMVVRDDLVLTNGEAQSGIDQISIPAWALLANDTGPSHNLLSLIASGNAVDGTVTHNATAPVFNEESNNARDGGSFTYTASIDGSTALDTSVVTVDRGQSGESTLDGTFRDEILLGRDGGNDTLNGNDGNDILIGLGGTDTLNGGNGNDILAGGAGNDALNGGNGVDTASYIDANSAVVVNLATGTSSGGGGVDTFSSIENLIGSDYNDTLTGNSSSNYLYGGKGADSLSGGSGADFLVGGVGNDALNGGNGHDTFIWEKGGLGGTDTISDFTLTGANSDVLDLSQLLSGVTQTGTALDDYLSFNFGSTTTVNISTTPGGGVAQSVVLTGVDLAAAYGGPDAATVINGMLNDHTLKTDTV